MALPSLIFLPGGKVLMNNRKVVVGAEVCCCQQSPTQCNPNLYPDTLYLTGVIRHYNTDGTEQEPIVLSSIALAKSSNSCHWQGNYSYTGPSGTVYSGGLAIDLQTTVPCWYLHTAWGYTCATQQTRATPVGAYPDTPENPPTGPYANRFTDCVVRETP